MNKVMAMAFVAISFAWNVSAVPETNGRIGTALPENIENLPELTHQIDALVTAYHNANRFDGTVLVAKGDQVIYQKGFGLAERSWAIPNGPETRYRIASVTKQFTAALILRMMEEGLLDIDAPISRYLPEYPMPQGQDIKLSNLLNHTSGIPNFTNLPGWDARKRDPYTPEEAVAVFSALTPEFKPGEKYKYSNSNYSVLGLIIERVTGKQYSRALQEWILNPQGLKNTGYHHRNLVVDRMARGYIRQTLAYAPEKYADVSHPYAAGMLYSTVGDLHQWKRALHTGHVFKNPETLAAMLTPFGGKSYGYGFGISRAKRVFDGEEVAIYAHGGRIEAFTTEDRYIPNGDWTVIAISNAFDNPNTVANGIHALLIGKDAPPPKLGARWLLVELIADHGAEKAFHEYQRLFARNEAGYDFSEGQLNILGYEYLTDGDFETAIGVLKLNTKNFPVSFNTWDSLGEAYLQAGEFKPAFENYSKSLKLNPENRHAAEVIEGLKAKLK
jgi:CubicO group peptidase (beta-lactamase class C family)